MNGYYQIPIKKLKVVKDKVIFTINSKSYTYNPRGKYLLRIIKNAGYELSQIHIGFMIKDGNVISNDDLEIIKKRILQNDPNSKLIKEKPNKDKLKKTKISEEESRSKQRKSKRKVKDTKKKTIKLTYRFRSVQLSVSKLEFQIDQIQLRYGDYIFNDKAVGAIAQYNTLKNRKEVTINKISVKINNEIAIIDEDTKEKLLAQFNTAKTNYDQEQVQALAKEQEIKRNNSEDKKKKSNKKVDKKIVVDKSETVSDNWNHIIFYNNKITYRGKWFDAIKSQTYLNHLKPFFHRKSFLYKVLKTNSKIVSVSIPNKVYELVRLGKQIDDILNINKIGKFSTFTFSLNKYGLEYYDLLSILGKSKTIYLEYLFDNQIENFEIICIPEPIFQNGELVKRDISFIFMLGNVDNPLVIWESVEPNKASYIFDIDINSFAIEKVLNTIQTFLLLEEPYKRSILRRSSTKLIEGVDEIHSLRHEYYFEKDITWMNNIENQLRKRR